jgi:hypothetical protein
MAALTEGVYQGEFVQAESPGKISRDVVTVTVAASTILSPGQVLGKYSSSGKYVPVDSSDSLGNEVAAAILFSICDNSASLSSADFTDAVVINFGAEVRDGALIWGTSNEATGKTQLATNGVKVR